MYKNGDRIVVKQGGGSYRPATFVSYNKNSKNTIANIQYTKRYYVVPVEYVIPEEVYLSPLWEALKEEE